MGTEQKTQEIDSEIGIELLHTWGKQADKAKATEKPNLNPVLLKLWMNHELSNLQFLSWEKNSPIT